MKAFCFIAYLCLTFATIYCINLDETINTNLNEVETVETSETVKTSLNETFMNLLTNKLATIVYTLYTRKINDTPVTINENNWKLMKQYALLDKEFKFLTHGWLSGGTTDTLQRIKNAYLEDRDINVVIVNWSAIADDILYPVCAVLTENVGKVYGELLNHLLQNGLELKLLHLIGHSLGAHVSAFAARSIKTGKAHRLTGLDPALPGFRDFHGISKNDAEFVDIIHTCAGLLGEIESIGHVDFYPNGGISPQPGCQETEIVSCSHGRSHEFFEASINPINKFTATNCGSWKKFKSDTCHSAIKTFMGDRVSLSARGDFYLTTNAFYPYAEQGAEVESMFFIHGAIIRHLRSTEGNVLDVENM